MELPTSKLVIYMYKFLYVAENMIAGIKVFCMMWFGATVRSLAYSDHAFLHDSLLGLIF